MSDGPRERLEKFISDVVAKMNVVAETVENDPKLVSERDLDDIEKFLLAELNWMRRRMNYATARPKAPTMGKFTFGMSIPTPESKPMFRSSDEGGRTTADETVAPPKPRRRRRKALEGVKETSPAPSPAPVSEPDAISEDDIAALMELDDEPAAPTNPAEVEKGGFASPEEVVPTGRLVGSKEVVYEPVSNVKKPSIVPDESSVGFIEE